MRGSLEFYCIKNEQVVLEIVLRNRVDPGYYFARLQHLTPFRDNNWLELDKHEIQALKGLYT